MGIFLVAFSALFIGIVLILFLKKTSPPPPQEVIRYANVEDKPRFLRDRDAFKEACIAFLEKFHLEYQHAIWANDSELEIALKDETPVVGGVYLALVIFEPENDTVGLHKVSGFMETVKGEEAAKGILITTGYFARDAIQSVVEHPVELVDVVAFMSYLKKFGLYDSRA